MSNAPFRPSTAADLYPNAKPHAARPDHRDPARQPNTAAAVNAQTWQRAMESAQRGGPRVQRSVADLGTSDAAELARLVHAVRELTDRVAQLEAGTAGAS